MNRTFAWVTLGVVACQGPGAGTFVGNPTMTARLVGNPVQQVVGGELDVLELHFVDTDDSRTALGAATFTFDGPGAEETVKVPTGHHSGLFLAVDQFVVRFDEGVDQTTIVADDFDLSIPTPFTTLDGESYVLRFGDESWLAKVAALSDPGEIQLNGSDPELDAAFYDGLMQGSEVQNAR